MSPTFGNFCPQLLGIWDFLSPTFGIFCPQLLGTFVPNFWGFGNFCPQPSGNFCPQLLGVFVPNFWGKVGDKNSQKVGDNNSIPMGKIIVPNFSQPKKLGTIIIPIGIELLSTNVNEPFRGKGPLRVAVPRTRSNKIACSRQYAKKHDVF